MLSNISLRMNMYIYNTKHKNVVQHVAKHCMYIYTTKNVALHVAKHKNILDKTNSYKITI